MEKIQRPYSKQQVKVLCSGCFHSSSPDRRNRMRHHRTTTMSRRRSPPSADTCRDRRRTSREGPVGRAAWQCQVVTAAALLCHGQLWCHAFFGSNPQVAFRSLRPPHLSPKFRCTLRPSPANAVRILKQGRTPLMQLRSRYDDETSRSYYWEGDDRRLWTRWMRQFRSSRARQFESRPGQTLIVGTLVVLYLYQVVTTLAWMRAKFPVEWGAHWFRILVDVGMGTALPGPVLQRGGMGGAHTGLVRARNPGELHRYLLSGFLHGSVLHWLLDVHSLSSRRRIPAWLETGLGTPLFVTTFIVSVLAGNVALSQFATDRLPAASLPSFLCGASGGICGLHGLHLVSLLRMRSKGDGDGLGRALRSLLWTMLYGYLIPEVALVANVGGLVGGALVGFLFGPRYSSSYGMKRKWSTEVDVYARDYRRAMGFGIQPRSPVLPLPYFWAAAALLVASVPPLRSVPRAMWEVLTLAMV